MQTHPLSRRADSSATDPHSTSSRLLIDAKATCALLSIGERRLWVLTNMRAIPSRKIGKSVRYSPIELDAWVRCGCPTAADAADHVRKAVQQ